MKTYYEDEFVKLYHADWQDVIDFMPQFDLLLTDPPYGIQYDPHFPNRKKFKSIVGDEAPITKEKLNRLRSSSPHQIIWGANNFSNILPKGGWIVWDKRVVENADKMLGSPFELAWTTKETLYKFIRLMHGGAVSADNMKERRHPTQKPIKLMLRCIEFFPNTKSIFDPFAGAGSVLLAAKRKRIHAVGVEIEEEYCSVIATRLGRLPEINQEKGRKGFFIWK